MLASDFIRRLKTKSFQNISTEQYDDDDWVFYINAANNYLYRYFNARSIWPFSAYEELIVPTTVPSTQFNSTYTIQWMISDKFSSGQTSSVSISWYNTIETSSRVIDDSSTGVWADASSLTSNDWQQLVRKNFFTTPGWNEFAFMANTTGIYWVITGTAYSSLLLRYKRWPAKLETADINTTNIDLPDDLLGALQNIVLRYAMPIYLENGVNLSKWYQEQAIEDMKNYAELIGLMIDNDKFTA